MMKFFRGSRLAATMVVMAIATATTGHAIAQAGSSRIIIAYPPGGASDGLARHLAQSLTEPMQRSFIVENRPGGSTVVAAQAALSAKPDGTTLAVFDPSTVAMNQYLFKKAPYDPTKFVAVARLTNIPFGIMVLPSFPANTLAEFVAYAKANPGLSFGSSGAGNPVHLAMEQFASTAGLKMTHIPYKGVAVIPDLIGGQIPVMMLDLPSAMAQVKAGKVKVIALTSAKRSSLLPNVPTISESGYPGFEASSWFSAFLPPGSDAGTVMKYSNALKQAMASPDIASWLATVSLEAAYSTPQELETIVQRDAEKYQREIKRLGLSLD